MPKQVGLIIPRGPFLNLEWFVGLLKGDNWIHTELAAGMHTQSAAECECSRPGIVSHPEICTYKSQCPCTTPHKWLQWKGVPHSFERTSGMRMWIRMFARERLELSKWELERNEVCVLDCGLFTQAIPRCTACTRACKGVLLRIYQSSSKLWESQHGCGASPGPLTNRVQPFWLGECQQAQALSKIHSNCDSPNTIPAMQMQTCIIFAQIPLRATILTTVHSH